MRGFLCSDGGSNKTLSARSSTVEIRFIMARGLKNASRDLRREKIIADNILESSFPLENRPRIWTNLIRNAGMDRDLRKEQLPI